MKFINYELRITNYEFKKIVIVLVLWAVGLGVGLIGGNYWWNNRNEVSAADRVLTTTADFDGGRYMNMEADSKQGQLKLKADGSWGPRVFTVPNVNLGNESPIASDGNYIYVIASADNYFARYIPAEDKWETLASAPHYAYPGSDMVVLGDYVYAVFGGYQREFSRYSIVNDTWEEMAMLLDITYGGTSLSTDGNEIYCLRGHNTNDFWKYDVQADRWTPIGSTPLTIRYGADLSYSSETNKMYTPRGNSSNVFYIYDLGTSIWSIGPTLPETMTEDSNSDIGGTVIYVPRGIGTSTFWAFNVGTTQWSILTGTPQITRYVGAVYNAAEDKVYVFRGNGTPDFWKYDPGANSFPGPTDLPAAPGTGSDLIYSDGYWYYNRGGTTAMYRYNGAVGATWQTMAVGSSVFSSDTKGVAVNGLLYYLQGGGARNFFSFSPSVGVGGSWGTLATIPAAIAPNYGAGLAYPGSGDYIYATRGVGTRTFMRYDMPGNVWSDVGVTDLPDDAEAGYGSRIIGVGTTELFYIAGNGVAKFLKYNITSDAWTVLGNLPFSPYYGTDMTYYGGKMYFQAGYYKRDIWEYTLATGEWRRLADISGYNASDSGPYNGGSLESDGAGNLYSINGANVLWIRSYSIGSSRYPGGGSWNSGTIDLEYAAGWSGINVGKTTPGDSSVSVYTRSSSNQTSWSPWQEAVGMGISSPINRYLQIGVSMHSSSGGSETPIINDITVSYIGDTGVPTNPTSISGLSQQVAGVGLTSGQSYSYNQPYFDWSGGGDTETSVAGYYVYFGTGTTATVDPAISGSYQTDSSYLVTMPMQTGTYSLLIKTKDLGGNVSNTWQAFVYVYNGVSPFISFAQASTPEFSIGTTAGVDISNNRIRLMGTSGFWEQERLSLLQANVTVGNGGDVAVMGNKLYIMRGNGGKEFSIYDLSTDVVSVGPTMPATVAAGGALVEGPPGYLYAMRGGGTSTFWRYDIGASLWSDALAMDTLQQTNSGAAMVYDEGNYIYALKGNGDDTFMRYDASIDNWEVMANNVVFGAPENQADNLVNLGGDLAYDVGTSRVYAIQGNLRTGFAVYDVNADSWSQLPNLPALSYYGARIEYDSGTGAVFYIPGWDKPFLYKYDVGEQVWTKISDAPAGLGYGANLRKVGGYLYVTRGASTTTIYKYNIAKNSWVVPSWNLFGGWWRGSDSRTFADGADIIRGDGNNMYIFRGNYDNLFVKYNATTGEVTKLTDVPAGIFRGSELVYDSVNNKIYASTSIYDKKFMVYDIATDEWSQVVGSGGTMPTDAGEGSSLVFDGSEYIYRLRGGNTQTFHKFSVNTGLWSTLPNTPRAMQYGSDLEIYNSNYYATRGAGTTEFFMFNPTLGVWSSSPAIARLPTGMTFNYDGFLVKGASDKMYGCRGGNTADCFVYSVISNTWTYIGTSMPANLTYGGAGAINQTGDKMYVIAGAGTNTYSNGLYSYVISTDNSSVGESGTFISGAHDLGEVFRYANLEVGYSAAPNTTLMVWTRTSDDGVGWGSWVQASSEKQIGSDFYYRIGSTAKRYIQVRFDLASGDKMYSGTIYDYKINYYQDSAPPTNPTIISAFDNGGMGSTLVSGTFYATTAPYFDWPGVGETGAAGDGNGGSGVNGYYVYFGLGETANPVSGAGTTYTIATAHTGTGMTTGNLYYLRLKAKDEAGNVASEVGTTFVFGYDGSPPTNPTTITADPPGYTATNSFAFSWSGAGDTGAGVEGYYYKTGSVGATEVFTTDSNVAGIAAYQTGTNTFYVRTKDLAGNVSEYTTSSYYWSSTAPGAPRDLRLTYPDVGTSNTVNEFAFAWSSPDPETYFGQLSGLRYYYSFNETPSVSNVNEVGLAVTYLSKGAYATRRDTNTLYVVAMDEAGNIDYRNRASIDFEASTSAPGTPGDIDISDVSIKESSAWRLALTWDTPVATGSGVSMYKVYRSTTTGAVCTSDFSDFEYASSTTGVSYVDIGLTQVKYYYCVKACDSTNECSAPSGTVSYKPDGKWKVAPTMTASPSATIKTKSATISWSTNRTSNSFVKYGKTSGTYGEEVGSSDQVSLHEITLTGLDPGTTYYYITQWTDEDGNTGSSAELNLTTNAAPFVSAVKVVDTGLYSVYVEFNLSNATTATVQYGKTISYGGVQTVTTSREASSYTVKIEGLDEGTEYHLRIAANDEEGNTFASDDYTFETLPVPKISGVKIQQVKGMPTATVRFLWKTNTGVSSIITYYPEGRAEMARDQISLPLTLNHEMMIKDLLDDTPYVFVIKGKDVIGNSAEPSPQKFTTSTDLRPPSISNLRLEASVAGVGEEAKAQITLYWDTDEPSTAQVEYGAGTGSDYPSKTQKDVIMVMNHTVTVTDLAPGQVYHLRVLAEDRVQNLTMSYDNVVITPKATRSALDLVVENLSKSFGFFNNLSQVAK
ncbi:MAG: fibronectin type III domain-containing protein [Candidatus Shapirobacteria bacterium]